jgi:hypothetical protein
VRYARQTRNATTFVAVLVGVLALLALIGVIVTAVEIAHIQNALNNAGTGTSQSCSNDPASPLPLC